MLLVIDTDCLGIHLLSLTEWNLTYVARDRSMDHSMSSLIIIGIWNNGWLLKALWLTYFNIKTARLYSSMQITWPWQPENRLCHSLITLRQNETRTKKLRYLCETLIVYILLSTFQLVHMVLTVNKPDVRRLITWKESAD